VPVDDHTRGHNRQCAPTPSILILGPAPLSCINTSDWLCASPRVLYLVPSYQPTVFVFNFVVLHSFPLALLSSRLPPGFALSLSDTRSCDLHGRCFLRSLISHSYTMRSTSLLIIVTALLLYLHAVTAVPYVLVNRQDDNPSSERSQAIASTDADSPRTTSTLTRQATAAKTQSDRSSTPTASSSIRVTASTIIQAPATTASDEPLPSSSAGESRDSAIEKLHLTWTVHRCRFNKFPSYQTNDYPRNGPSGSNITDIRRRIYRNWYQE
jgi:hypothetical protein